MAGIGGTGVITVAQILATGAMLDGWKVEGVDQTGLSQKAGPVISDLVLHHDDGTASNLIGRADADFILAFDGLVAANDSALGVAGPATVIVASSSPTPTGQMITNPDLAYPVGPIEERLATSGASDFRALDAATLASRLTGSTEQANLMVLGVALQHGGLPVSPTAIERAIELNATAVEANLHALDWGRRWSIDPAAVDSIADPGTIVGSMAPVDRRLARRISAMARTVELADCLTRLAGDLHDYQDLAYAQRFLDHVSRAVEAEVRYRYRWSATGDHRGPEPPQAHGLQGRVRGGQAHALARRRGGGSVGRWFGRNGQVAPASTDAQSARPHVEDQGWPVGPTGDQNVGRRQAASRHLGRPVRSDRHAPGRAGPRRRV